MDDMGNVLIRKPATAGMENRKGVVLQSHLDMVHQKNAEHVYHDYLVQLDAASLWPVQISSLPVISGGDCEGFWRGFLTVYSLLINDDQVIVSFGEGDRYAGVATASITEFTATPMQPLRSA